MRGHESLLALRRRGKRPPLVWVLATGRHDELRRWLRNYHHEGAHLEIEPGEDVGRLDLRCLVGLVVDVTGTDAVRVGEVARACAAAGAERVIATHYTELRVAGDVAVHINKMTFGNEELAEWPTC